MENSNRLIEEEVKKFHDKVEELRDIEIEEAVESPVVDFGCKIRQGDYEWKIVNFVNIKKFFRSSLEKVRQETLKEVEKEKELSFKEGRASMAKEHLKELNRVLNKHSKPIAGGGLNYIKAFEEMENYEHRLHKTIINQLEKE